MALLGQTPLLSPASHRSMTPRPHLPLLSGVGTQQGLRLPSDPPLPCQALCSAPGPSLRQPLKPGWAARACPPGAAAAASVPTLPRRQAPPVAMFTPLTLPPGPLPAKHPAWNASSPRGRTGPASPETRPPREVQDSQQAESWLQTHRSNLSCPYLSPGRVGATSRNGSPGQAEDTAGILGSFNAGHT